MSKAYTDRHHFRLQKLNKKNYDTKGTGHGLNMYLFNS